MKQLFAFVNTSNPCNSIYQQTSFLVKRLEAIYSMQIPVLTDAELDSHLGKDDELILWPYEAFSVRLCRIRDYSNVVFIYHNITPARFFWTTEPLVGCKALVGRLQLSLLRRTGRQWLAVSEYNLGELEKLGYDSPQLCYNQILPSEIRFEKSDEASIMFVGRIVQNKRCLEWLEMAKKVAESRQDGLTCYIVGNGKKGTVYLKRFIEKAAALRSNRLRIIHTTAMTQEELAEVYQRAWLYVSLSEHEGFGLPVCEAINNGTPAIYTACGGQEQLLRNNGLTTAENIAEKTAHLLEDASARQELLQAQKQIVRQFTIPAADSHIKQLFDRLIL